MFEGIVCGVGTTVAFTCRMSKLPKKNLDFIGTVFMHVLASIGPDAGYHSKTSVSAKLTPSETMLQA